jgi:aryl-alcohol dehydrogenase-like predicted oxidoreductase
MRRREFITRTACGLGAAWLGSKSWAGAVPLSRSYSATETVVLGQTGIHTSRLAMGTGTVGTGHHSHQTALGIQGLADLLLQGYDHGLRFFDSADSYGSHPHVAHALKSVPRDKITLLTKS